MIKIQTCNNCGLQNESARRHCKECGNVLSTDAVTSIEQNVLNTRLSTGAKSQMIDEAAALANTFSERTSSQRDFQIPPLPPKDTFRTLEKLISSLQLASTLGLLLAVSGAIFGFVLFQADQEILGVTLGFSAVVFGVPWYFILRIIAESADVQIVVADNTYLIAEEVRRAVELLQQQDQ